MSYRLGKGWTPAHSCPDCGKTMTLYLDNKRKESIPVYVCFCGLFLNYTEAFPFPS